MSLEVSNKELQDFTIEALQEKLNEVNTEYNKLTILTIDKVKERQQLKPLRKLRARLLTFMNQKNKEN